MPSDSLTTTSVNWDNALSRCIQLTEPTPLEPQPIVYQPYYQTLEPLYIENDNTECCLSNSLISPYMLLTQKEKDKKELKEDFDNFTIFLENRLFL